ncbi:MAGUK p55 subfamily member 3, partial [Taenia solium]
MSQGRLKRAKSPFCRGVDNQLQNNLDDLQLNAAYLVRNSLNKTNGLSKQVSEPLDQILTEEDRILLRNFLESNALKNILTSSSNKFLINLHPLISKLRPSRSDDRNCLVALNETWREIENLLTRATKERYSDAQELYDILSNDFVRELLVAVNGIGNCCYTTYADQNIEGEDETNDGRGNLDRPFSMSSLPQDSEPPTPSRNQGIKYPSEGSQQPHPPSTLSSVSTTWGLLKTLSCTSSTTLHHRNPSTDEFSNESANNRFPYHGLGRRVSEAGSKHPALPFHVENSLPKPGMLRTIYINRSSQGEPLGITLATYGSSQMPTRSASLFSLLGRQTQREINKDPPKIVIQRIIVGSLADKEGKLFPGDELIELDGVAATSLEAVQKAMVGATQKNVLQMIVKTPGIGQLKAYILSRNHPEHKVYIRCLFKYDPLKDALLPNGNLGIAFKNGDVLELVDSQDLNWWQVRRLGTPHLPVGLVPSQTLQERRQAFNQQACRLKINKKIKKVKSIFRAADSSNTTDSTATPTLFRIRTKEDMESDIRQGAYVEWGTSVYLLHQPEFNPHVVFVSAPKFEAAKAMMDIGIRENLTVNKRTSEDIRKIVEESKIFANQNQHLYAHTLVNSNMTESVEKLSQLVSKLEGQSGWIPASWAYEMSLPKSFGKDRICEDQLPRSSIFTGSGIPGLPEDNRSVISRVTNSILSVASPESAIRLARPPSVCSSLQLPDVASKGDLSSASGGRWRYEKRKTKQLTKSPLSPPCSLQTQLATESAFCNSESSKPLESIKRQIFPPRVASSNIFPKSIRDDAKTNDGDTDDAISSTSSEDGGF